MARPKKTADELRRDIASARTMLSEVRGERELLMRVVDILLGGCDCEKNKEARRLAAETLAEGPADAGSEGRAGSEPAAPAGSATGAPGGQGEAAKGEEK